MKYIEPKHFCIFSLLMFFFMIMSEYELYKQNYLLCIIFYMLSWIWIFFKKYIKNEIAKTGYSINIVMFYILSQMFLFVHFFSTIGENLKS